MDPGDTIVQRQSLDVIRDVVRRYDIDGVHIDDYFYPYPEKDAPFPDDPSYSNYTRHGGKLNRDDWRRSNVDNFVREMYQSVKRMKRWVKVGISPFGIYRPGYPSTIKTTFDQYAVLYADARKWLNEGWCDYYSPQLYWSSKTAAQNYGELLKWWMSENSQHRHVWPGNYTSRTGPEESKPWPASEIVDQIRITRVQEKDAFLAPGNIHFSMKAFMRNWGGIRDAVSRAYTTEAVVPACPWLSNTPPAAPRIGENHAEANTWTVSWKPVKNAIRYALIAAPTPGHPSRWTTTTDTTATVQTTKWLAIKAIDRFGNESEATTAAPQ